MPHREEERSANQKDPYCYCYTHKRYYVEEVGCQLCYIGQLNPKATATQVPELKQCHLCHQISLFWNEQVKRFECLNSRCEKSYSGEEYEAVTAFRFDEILKCPRCGEVAVRWNRYFVYYECGECKKAFAKDEMVKPQ